MRIRGIASAIAAVMLLYGAPSGAATKGCRLHGLGTLDVETQDGNLTVEARINGKPIHLIVDTGSEFTLLFRQSAKTLGLTVRPLSEINLYSVTGKESSGETTIKQFGLANLMIPNAELGVLGGDRTVGPEGLLGAYFLLQNDVEFDLAAK